MTIGIKSKYFHCYWDSMFISAMSYPEKINKNSKEDLLKQKHFKIYFNSFKYVVSCKFCRDYIKTVLEKEFPLDFSGRVQLMHSIYLWKDSVNKKLIKQKCDFTKKSPPFEKILKKYEKLRATCDKKIGKCV